MSFSEWEMLVGKYDMASDFEIKIHKEDAFFQNSNNVKWLSDTLRNINVYDCPDMYSLVNNEVLIIEHFEFDSSNKNKKGSSARVEIARVKREFNKKSDSFNGNILIQDDKIDTNNSAENYIENFTNVFDSHYSKIDLYKENISKIGVVNDTTKIKTCFFIEDTTPLGNFINENGNPRCVNLFYIKEYLDIFKKSDKVDCVFFWLL